MNKEETNASPFSIEKHHSLQKKFQEKINHIQSHSKEGLHHFGLKTPNDVYQFLLSPEGKNETAHAFATLTNNELLNNQKALELQEKLAKRLRLSALLFLYFIEKKSHAAKQLTEFLEEQEEQQNNLLKEKQQESYSSSQAKNNSQEELLYETLKDFDKALLAYQHQHLELSQETQHLQERLQLLHMQHENTMDKYEVYQKSLHEFETQFNESIDLNEKISQLEKELHEQTDAIMSLLETGKELEARHLLHHQNALNLQIATLYDIKAQQQGDKYFLDEGGEEVQSPLNAAFVLPMDKKIVHENGKYYLLNKVSSFSDLNSEEKEQAHVAFKKEKQTLMSPQKVVMHTQQAEQQFQNKQIEALEDQLRDTQTRLQLTYQFTRTLNHKRDDLSKKLEEKLPEPSKATKQFMQQNEALFRPGLNCKILFTEVARQHTPKDSKEIKSYLHRLFVLQGIGTIPSYAPLPPTTMNALLQHMARFGALPYKHSVTPLEPPTTSLSHGPFSKTPLPKLY